MDVKPLHLMNLSQIQGIFKKKTGTASRNGGQSFEFQRARLDEDWIGTATN